MCNCTVLFSACDTCPACFMLDFMPKTTWVLSTNHECPCFGYFPVSLMIFTFFFLFMQVAYLNHDTFFTSVSLSKENLSSFFLWDLPVVEMSPEWVTGPEQGKSSGRIANFSLWTGMFRDGISSVPDETVILLWLGHYFLICETGTGQQVLQLHDRRMMMMIFMQCLVPEQQKFFSVLN